MKTTSNLTPLLFAVPCVAVLGILWFTGASLNALILLAVNLAAIAALLAVTRLSGLPRTTARLGMGIAAFAVFQVVLNGMLLTRGFAADIARNSQWLVGDRIVVKLDDPVSSVAIGTLLYAALAWRWGWLSPAARPATDEAQVTYAGGPRR